MNCEHFEEVILELVRDGGMEEAVRVEALAHAGSCASCQTRLQSQRALSAILKLGAADGAEAPAHVEASLLSAYRLRGEKAAEPASAGRARFLRSSYFGIAAAVLVTVLGVVMFRSLQTDHPVPPAEPAPGASATASSRFAGGEPATVHPVPKDEPAPIAVRLEPAAKRPAPRRAAPKTQPGDSEIATDFFPLASRAEIASMESGQIVRVLLPRNTMAAYGLPVSQERMDEPVAAQVLIGQDGVARAIRFLNAQNASYVPVGLRSKR